MVSTLGTAIRIQGPPRGADDGDIPPMSISHRAAGATEPRAHVATRGPAAARPMMATLDARTGGTGREGRDPRHKLGCGSFPQGGRVDTLDRIRKEINDRLAELRPVAREYERLQHAHAALEASGPADDTAGRSGRAADGSGARRTRSAPRGSAREQILAAARDNPEAKRGDIAKLTGLSPNTVGTTLSKLRAEGLLPRSSRSRAAATPDPATPPAVATDPPSAEPPAEPASAAGGDGPQGELHRAETAEDADRAEATPEPAEAEPTRAEPVKRRATRSRSRPAKAPSE
jgi:DNA-binding transcriptional ArsR family regulator